MFARKPSRSTTGDEAGFAPAVALEEAQPAARRVAAATPAASSTRRINVRLSRSLYYPDQLSRDIARAQPGSSRPAGGYGVALTVGALTWWPRNKIAATWVIVS